MPVALLSACGLLPGCMEVLAQPSCSSCWSSISAQWDVLTAFLVRGSQCSYGALVGFSS